MRKIHCDCRTCKTWRRKDASLKLFGWAILVGIGYGLYFVTGAWITAHVLMEK